MSFFRWGPGDSLVVERKVRLPGPARRAAFLEGNPARIARYALLSGEGDSLHVVSVRRKSTEVMDFALPGKADGIMCADIDSDGQREVIAFGRKMPGLSVLRREPGGMLNVHEPFFPEISATDAAVLDVDGDGVNDVFLLDWLNDRLIFYQGIGRGSFSEPASVDLPGEPAACSVMSRGEHLWVAVTIPSEKRIVVLATDSSERLVPFATATSPWEPEGVALRDVNGDGRPDIVCAGGGEVAVMAGMTDGRFRPPIHYAVPGTPAVWTLEDIDGDRLPDLLVADGSRRTIGAATHSVSSRFRSGTTYLAGKGITDLLITKVAGEGRMAVTVVSAEALTVFAQSGGRMLEAANVVDLAPGARRASEFPYGGRPGFVVSFPATEELAVVAVHPEPSVVQFPAGADPRVLLTGFDQSSGTPWILSRTRPGTRREYALAVYEQVNERQYLERRVGSRLVTGAVAMSAFDGRDGIPPALILVTRAPGERTSRITACGIGARGDPVDELVVASLDDSIGRIGWVMADDLDRDGKLDLILGFRQPTRRVAALYGQGRPALPGDLIVVDSLSIADADRLEARDVDGDGRKDLVFWGEGRRSVRVAYGSGQRSFGTAETLVRGDEYIAFAAAPLFGGCDLVVAEARGTLTVFHSPFRKNP